MCVFMTTIWNKFITLRTSVPQSMLITWFWFLVLWNGQPILLLTAAQTQDISEGELEIIGYLYVMMVWLFSLICELNNDFPYVWSISIRNSINCSGQSKNVILIFNGIIQENLERVWARVPVTQTTGWVL